METINIKLSKSKIALSIIASLLFIIFGISFIINPYKFTTILIKNILLIRLIGIITILFFGLALITLVRKLLFDKNLGIIINEEGIIDNSSFVGVGLIRWEDIISIEKRKVGSTRFLLIFINNPELYITKSNKIKARLLRANFTSYGTPISISSNFVNYSFTKLEVTILNSFEKYKVTEQNL